MDSDVDSDVDQKNVDSRRKEAANLNRVNQMNKDSQAILKEG